MPAGELEGGVPPKGVTVTWVGGVIVFTSLRAFSIHASDMTPLGRLI